MIMKRKGSSIGSLFIGILIGGLVGTGIALLAAPQSGEQTRSLLMEKGTDLRNRASSTVEQTRGKAEDIISIVRSRADDFTNRLASKREEIIPESEITAS
jgi:gas vesicle protein